MANKKAGRRMKRKFQGNQYKDNKCSRTEPHTEDATNSIVNDNNDFVNDTEHQQPGISRKKIDSHKNYEKNCEIQLQDPDTPTVPTKVLSGFMLFDVELLRQAFCQLLCPQCGEGNYKIEDAGKMGFAFSLNLTCSSCGWCTSFANSATVTTTSKGQKPYEVNERMVMAFCNMGRGHEHMKSFCMHMNMRPPLAVTNYVKAVNRLHGAYMIEASDSMRRASETVKAAGDECAVSVDGTWQRRGHASLNGVVTAISASTGKCLDFQVKSKVCAACNIWDKKDKTSPEYLHWNSSHVCSINHKGSASSMETESAKEIFGRSKTNYGLEYTTFIGDGDSASFKQVHDSMPYGDKEVIKRECVGHIQKRVGSRLRQLKKDYKGKKLDDKKLLTGSKGRLTETMMNKLQNYFGIAIRSNKGNLAGMKNDTMAVLPHCASTDANPMHDLCNAEWCGYKKEPETYKHRGGGLDTAVVEVVKPIFVSLCNDELLKKCVDCYTQNPNESLNGLIWQRCPKEIFCGRKVIELSVASAVCQFNDGAQSCSRVLARLGVVNGLNTSKSILLKDSLRIAYNDRQSSLSCKNDRKRRRAIRKGFADKNKQQEGELYATGKF